jgi:DHA2 family multidrug resistance protein-like MFS transporter
VAIVLISCTFLDKSLYIVTVFFSNVLFGLGLGCYATPSTDTAVVNAPENKRASPRGFTRWAARWAARWELR